MNVSGSLNPRFLRQLSEVNRTCGKDYLLRKRLSSSRPSCFLLPSLAPSPLQPGPALLSSFLVFSSFFSNLRRRFRRLPLAVFVLCGGSSSRTHRSASELFWKPCTQRGRVGNLREQTAKASEQMPGSPLMAKCLPSNFTVFPKIGRVFSPACGGSNHRLSWGNGSPFWLQLLSAVVVRIRVWKWQI